MNTSRTRVRTALLAAAVLFGLLQSSASSAARAEEPESKTSDEASRVSLPDLGKLIENTGKLTPLASGKAYLRKVTVTVARNGTATSGEGRPVNHWRGTVSRLLSLENAPAHRHSFRMGTS